MALTRIQYMGPTSTGPIPIGDPEGARTGASISVQEDGSLVLNPTGVAAGAYFSADITVGLDGRIIRCSDGQPQINPLTDFEPGVIMLFGNATAPLNWVQKTGGYFDNTTIRLVNGTGGGVGGQTGFSEAFTTYTPSGTLNHNLSISGQNAFGQIGGVNLTAALTPPHTHRFGYTKVFQYQPNGAAGAWNGVNKPWTNTEQTDDTFNPKGTHVHSFTGRTTGASITGPITFVGKAATQFAVKYFNMIVAEST